MKNKLYTVIPYGRFEVLVMVLGAIILCVLTMTVAFLSYQIFVR